MLINPPFSFGVNVSSHEVRCKTGDVGEGDGGGRGRVSGLTGRFHFRRVPLSLRVSVSI